MFYKFNSESGSKSRKPKSKVICKCNNVDIDTIENAITNGCKTMNEIFDCTTAGVGPCGGSCRRTILPILETYLKTGQFPKRK